MKKRLRFFASRKEDREEDMNGLEGSILSSDYRLSQADIALVAQRHYQFGVAEEEGQQKVC
jgi:hypothetical protein